MTRLNDIKQFGKKFQGRRELLKHLEGKKLTMRQAAKAKCYDCMGFYTDGSDDCAIQECPLYPFMPYKPGGPLKDASRKGNPEALAASRKNKAKGTPQN